MKLINSNELPDKKQINSKELNVIRYAINVNDEGANVNNDSVIVNR